MNFGDRMNPNYHFMRGQPQRNPNSLPGHFQNNQQQDGYNSNDYHSHRHNSFRGGRGGNHNFRGFTGGGGRGQRGGWGHHGHGEDGRGRGKPQKMRIRENTRKESFYCCSCDRGFQTQEILDEHKTEHIVCGLDGCQFEAHSLVVTKHISIQHNGNLYERMKNLNTPEGLAAWRLERQKNFPTVQRIKEKREALLERISRREICGLQNKQHVYRPRSPEIFRYKIKSNDAQRTTYGLMLRKQRKMEYEQSDQWRFRKYTTVQNSKRVTVPFFSLNKTPVVTMENFYLNVKVDRDGKLQKQTKVKWKGITAKKLDRLTDSESEIEDNEIPISDDEDDFIETNVELPSITCKQNLNAPTTDPTCTTASGSSSSGQSLPFGLSLVEYSSGSDCEKESDDEHAVNALNASVGDKQTQSKDGISSEQEVSSTTKSLGPNTSIEDLFRQYTKESNSASYDNSNNCNRESEDGPRCESMVVEEFSNIPKVKPNSIARTIGSGVKFSRRRQFRTKLLETLLTDPIRKERNVLLQTCRYIRENNFFMDCKSTCDQKTDDEQDISSTTPSNLTSNDDMGTTE